MVKRFLPLSAFILVLVFCTGWVLTHAYFVDSVTVRLCEMFDKDIPKEKRMPVFLSEIAFDGYVWNRHAEKLGENGQWRVRHTDMDNAPEGREVHWNSAFAWYLRGLGEIYRAVTGDTLRNSIFRMSIWANSILLVLALVSFGIAATRRFGPLCGSVVVLGMVCVPTFYEGFMPAYPDHHGIISFTLLGMLFGIAWGGAGWVQKPEGKDFVPAHSLAQARSGMIFSGVCGAAELWISALSTAPVAVGIGLAALGAGLAASWTKERKPSSTYHPELWGLWGKSVALTALALWLLEYLPNRFHLGMEINHPLYILAWFAGGVAIEEITRWLMLSNRTASQIPWLKLVLCGLACILPPMAMLLGKDRVFVMFDPFMAGLSKQIAETLPLLTRIKLGGLTWQIAIGWFPALLLSAWLLLWAPKLGRGTKFSLLALSLPILFITCLQFYQTRWGMLAGPLYIALAGIVIPQIWRLVPADAANRSVAGLMLLGFGFIFVEPAFKNSFTLSGAQFRSGDKLQITPGQGLALIHRQMARAILDDADGKPVVLLSSPNSSCLLATLGGFKTVGTLYWENVPGLKKAAAALNAQTDDEALEWMKKLGITHISFLTWENFMEPYFRLLHPSPSAGVSFLRSFGKRAFFDKSIPPWSRPIIFPANDLTRGVRQDVLLLAVAPNQSITDAQLYQARFVRFVQGDLFTAESILRQALRAAPSAHSIQWELCDILVASGRYTDGTDLGIAALTSAPEEQRTALATRLTERLEISGQTLEAAKVRAAISATPSQP